LLAEVRPLPDIPLEESLSPPTVSSSSIVGFSLVRAKNSSLVGDTKGRIEFVNTFTDLNGAWDGRRSVFQCQIPGLYFFSFNGRGATDKKDGGNEDEFWM
jgi:hypothetical protein